MIAKTVEFLGKPRLSSEDVDKLLDHLSFEKMKKNPSVNYEDWLKTNRIMHKGKPGDFFRCGKIDQWKTVMTPENIRKFDERTEAIFEANGLRF